MKLAFPQNETMVELSGDFEIFPKCRFFLISAAAGDVHLTVKPSSEYSDGDMIVLKRVDSSENVVSVTPAPPDTIDGEAVVQLPAYGILKIIAHNGIWLKF